MIERLVFTAITAAAMTLALGRWTIPQLRRWHVQQRIREETGRDARPLPARHQGKAGTPTMGGVFLVAAIVLATLTGLPQRSADAVLALVVMGGYGVVGALDDLLAVRRGRNLGLRARERLAIQIPLAAAMGLYIVRRPELGSGLVLPGLGAVDLGGFYLAFAVLYTVGFANAVNLTDGLDGLAAGTVAIASGAYAVVAVKVGRPEVAVLAAAVVGACAGFAWFNAHPAAVFMGDTGSNALGAVLAGMAIVTKTEWLLLVIGFVFVLEAASVLLQVAYFKATGGRRIFRMSPLHHHFELSGWTETQTVMRMWLIGVFAALLGMMIVF